MKQIAEGAAGMDTLAQSQMLKAPTQSPETQELEKLCENRMRFVVANTLDVFLQQAVPQINNRFDDANSTDDSQNNQILFVEVRTFETSCR